MAEMSDAEVFGTTTPPPAAPRELSDAEVFGAPPARAAAAQFGALPSPSEFGDLSAQPWAQPGPPPSPATPVDRSAPPPGDTQLTTEQVARERALEENANKSGYFALEPSEPGFKHLLWSLGAPFAAIGQTALGERPIPTGVQALEAAAPLAGMGDVRFTARPHPMMQTYEAQSAALQAAREEAQRFGPPEPPTPAPVTPGPPDLAVESGVAKVRGQLGMGQEPPAPSPIPAEAVPPGVPPGTPVPESLRIKAAIDATQPPPPSFVPQTNVDPLTGQATPVRVPPGAAGPETVPYSHPMMDEFNKTEAAAGAAPTEAAAASEAVANRAWVNSTRDEIAQIVKENADAGGPRSLSAAATPQEVAAMSPQMAKAYRRMAEVNRVISPIEGLDNTVYVEGSLPTRAEAMGDPIESQKEVMTRQRAPEHFEGEQGRLTQNTKARLRLYDDQTLSDPQIETLNERQAAQARADTAAINAKAGPVDGASVATQLKQILSDPRIKEQPDVVRVLKPIHDALYDADGNLKTNIQSYWGMHDNLMNQLAKAKDPLHASSSEKFAFNQLLAAKNAVDGAMSKATDGAFQTFLDNQAEFFKSKNAARILTDFRPKMINSKTGSIYADRFHKFVTDLAVRRGKPGVDPAMDIPDPVFDNLMRIDDDLKRAARIDLGKPRGSPTNLYFELAQGLGIAGAHSLIAGMGPVAHVGLQVGIGALQRRIGAANLNRLVRRALDDPASTLPPNPNPPGQFVPPSLRNRMGGSLH